MAQKHMKRNTSFLQSKEIDPHGSAPGMTVNAGRVGMKWTLACDAGESGKCHGILEMQTGCIH